MNIKDLASVTKILTKEFNSHKAPIVDFIAAQTHDPFCILVATILSARTKDRTTTIVVEKLFREVPDIESLKKVPLKKLEKLCYPAGFFRQKAKHLKKLPKALDDYFDGIIPETVEELCKLPGVGRKTANLVVSIAFDKPAICVDVHVHRISNRFGLIETSTPFETEMTLREIMPVKYWKSWNSIIVSFGQTRCSPRNPKCTGCPIITYCDRVNLPNKP